MAAEQNGKTYEVGFLMEKFQHIFYIDCPDDSEAKTFAHAVFHYYDTPDDWGRKRGVTTIAAIKPTNCLPDFLHIAMVSKEELPMPEENEESHRAVKNALQKVMEAGYQPMAIYDEEKKVMTVYSAREVEAAPQDGASSVVQNFSNFGGIPGQKK